jgi:autotransporter family porin
VDVLGAWLRGCYEGWVWWLRDHGNSSRGAYAEGDIWGCVGAWYSGDWHDGSIGVPSGENYIDRAEKRFKFRPWLQPGF